jgi:hypothetical protein
VGVWTRGGGMVPSLFESRGSMCVCHVSVVCTIVDLRISPRTCVSVAVPLNVRTHIHAGGSSPSLMTHKHKYVRTYVRLLEWVHSKMCVYPNTYVRTYYWCSGILHWVHKSVKDSVPSPSGHTYILLEEASTDRLNSRRTLPSCWGFANWVCTNAPPLSIC